MNRHSCLKCWVFVFIMESRIFKIDNYIHVPGFAIVNLKLSGNELLCYSLIYGFTQDGEAEFNGSLSYIASALNITKQNAKKVIERLIERGLVTKKDIYFSGVKFCHYIAKSNAVAISATPENNDETALSFQQRPVAISATNNNINNNKYINNDNNPDGVLLIPEPEQEIQVKKRGTSENLCLFANSKYNDFETFMACFKGPEYAAIDVGYYYNVVADWSSSKGAKKRDWIATARNIMRNDETKGKLRKCNPTNPGGFSNEALEYLNFIND